MMQTTFQPSCSVDINNHWYRGLGHINGCSCTTSGGVTQHARLPRGAWNSLH